MNSPYDSSSTIRIQIISYEESLAPEQFSNLGLILEGIYAAQWVDSENVKLIWIPSQPIFALSDIRIIPSTISYESQGAVGVQNFGNGVVYKGRPANYG